MRATVRVFNNFPISLPPSHAQEQIVAYLDRGTERTDSLARTVQAGIDRLKELRTALISAAVTGKIDVLGEV